MSDPTQPMSRGGSENRLLAGRYRLEGILGRGGMATVYAGTDTVLDRPVAVKILDLQQTSDPVMEERFRREARATAALNDAHIVTVYDTGVADHAAYLVMERLPGRTLADAIRERGPLPIPEVRAISSQVAQALSVAHAAGVVHRDIKPGNIAYAASSGTAVKVVDFGITQLLDRGAESHPLTMTNTVIGTAEYLSPEQGVGGRVDARADLYALGCVLYAMLTGEAPFSGPTPVAVLMAHQQQLPPDVRDLRPDTPPELAELIARLLAKNPADRPGSAELVAQALLDPRSAAATEVLAGPGPTAVIPPPVAAGPPPTRVSPPPTAVVPPPSPSAPPATAPARLEKERSKAWIPVLIVLVLVAIGGVLLIQNWDRLAPGEAGTPTTSAGPQTQTSAPVAPTPTEIASTPAQTPTDETPGSDISGQVQAMRGALAGAGQAGALSASDVAKGNQALNALQQAHNAGDSAGAQQALSELGAVVGAAQQGDSDSPGGQAEAVASLQAAYGSLASAVRG